VLHQGASDEFYRRTAVSFLLEWEIGVGIGPLVRAKSGEGTASGFLKPEMNSQIPKGRRSIENIQDVVSRGEQTVSKFCAPARMSCIGGRQAGLLSFSVITVISPWVSP